MATTTNYGWETPDDTDLLKDGASAIRTLGSSIDTTTKNLNPETTLGDISYRSSTANTNTRLAIGTSGQILTVSGGVPTWATPASSAPVSGTATVATRQTTTTQSYTDLTTSGPSVTLTTGTKVLVGISADLDNSQNTGGGAVMDFAISGATTRSATDTTALRITDQVAIPSAHPFRMSAVTNLTGLTAGSNTFTAKYRSDGGYAAGFANRSIFVIDLGS